MKKPSFSYWLALAGLVVGLAACATAEQRLRDAGATPLNDDELTNLFAAVPRKGTWKGAKAAGTIEYQPDGTQRATWKGGADSGVYEIRDGKICGTWQNLRNGQERCFTVYRQSEMVYDTFDASGRHNVTVTFQ